MTTAVPVVAMPRRFYALLIVVFGAPAVLHVFLWSRVVSMHCERAGVGVACVVDESSLVSSSSFARDATHAVRAAVRGSRGSRTIALVGPDGERDLSSGFNGDERRMRAVAAELTNFLRTPGRASFDASFGSRWFTAQIFAVVDGLGLLVLYVLLGQRVRATVDRGRGTIELRRRLWPLRGVRFELPLAQVCGVEVRPVSRQRFRLVAVTGERQAVPLSWPLGVPALLAPAAARLDAWVARERSEAGGAPG